MSRPSLPTVPREQRVALFDALYGHLPTGWRMFQITTTGIAYVYRCRDREFVWGETAEEVLQRVAQVEEFVAPVPVAGGGA